MTVAKGLVVGNLLEADQASPLWFDPVDPIVPVVATSGLPESNVQSYVRALERFTEDRCVARGIRDDLAATVAALCAR